MEHDFVLKLLWSIWCSFLLCLYHYVSMKLCTTMERLMIWACSSFYRAFSKLVNAVKSYEQVRTEISEISVCNNHICNHSPDINVLRNAAFAGSDLATGWLGSGEKKTIRTQLSLSINYLRNVSVRRKWRPICHHSNVGHASTASEAITYPYRN